MKRINEICLPVFLVGMVFFVSGQAQAVPVNLLRNPSFENVPCATPCNQDQAFMPSEWLTSQVTPDTYSNDGSYGILPGDFGNFTGVTAQDGIRWVAGWSSAGHERFGQTLTAPLTAGEDYDFSGYLHQAIRDDLNFPGGYELYLTSSSAGASLDTGVFLGLLGPTTSFESGWDLFSLSFTAPGNAGSLPFLMFNPVVTGAGAAYPGLDNVSLSLTAPPGPGPLPEPPTVLLLGLGWIGLVATSSLRRIRLQ